MLTKEHYFEHRLDNKYLKISKSHEREIIDHLRNHFDESDLYVAVNTFNRNLGFNSAVSKDEDFNKQFIDYTFLISYATFATSQLFPKVSEMSLAEWNEAIANSVIDRYLSDTLDEMRYQGDDYMTLINELTGRTMIYPYSEESVNKYLEINDMTWFDFANDMLKRCDVSPKYINVYTGVFYQRYDLEPEAIKAIKRYSNDKSYCIDIIKSIVLAILNVDENYDLF